MKSIFYTALILAALILSTQLEVHADTKSSPSQTSYITPLTFENFNDTMASSKYVVIKVYADWCGPCVTLAPIYEKLAQKYADTIVFTTLDCSTEYDLVNQLNVTALPTILFFKDEIEVGMSLGLVSQATLEQRMLEAFN